MLVGIVHRVMDTDTMTISGETIDHGPVRFHGVRRPASVYSSIDTGGGCAYGNRAAAAQFNLARLAEDLLTPFADDEGQCVPLAGEPLAEAAQVRNPARWEQ